MEGWILTAAIGGLVSVAGLAAVFRRYRRGEVTGWYVAAATTGLASFVAFAVVSAFRPALATGATALALLLPAFVAVVVLIREHGKSGRLQE